MTSIPTLDAYRDGITLQVWCTHCDRWHSHGVCSGDPDCPCMRSGGRKPCTCPTGSGDGHRIAHCGFRVGPYADTGYNLREVGSWKDRPKPHRRTRRRVSYL